MSIKPTFLATCLLLLLSTMSLSAHPHIWIDVEYSPVRSAGRITAVDVVWYFDELYSSSYLIDFDVNADKTFQVSEVEQIYENAFKHLIESDYFTYIQANGRTRIIGTATNFESYFRNDKVEYRFRLPLASPVSELQISSWDPSNFIAFYVLEGSYEVAETRFDIAFGDWFRTRAALF